MTTQEFFNTMVEKTIEITGWKKSSAQQSCANFMDERVIPFNRPLNLFGAIDAARELCREFGF